MPTNKDQKRLVRARMKKTGESYTAARAVVVAHKKPRGAASHRASGSSPTRYAAPRDQWASLAGKSDEIVKERTGRTWAGWVTALDKAGADTLPHGEIARHIATAYPEVSGWWAQMVTVGYERIRGLRDVGQRSDGSFHATKSRTFPVAVSTLYPMFKDARRREAWLPDSVKRVRTAIANKSLRLDWHDGTQVNLYFEPKGTGKTTVSVEHAKLTSKADIARAKAFWNERLKALGDALRR
jgi:hypothetical protein